ncbi:MAG: DUF159 family protein [Candidatus Hydrogenedentota bacterium]
MCGRFSVTVKPDQLKFFIDLALANAEPVPLMVHDSGPPGPRYNVVPTNPISIVHIEDGSLHMRTVHWWILPPYATKDVEFRRGPTGHKTFRWKGPRKSHFNSRLDTIADPKRRYWHQLLKTKRCIIPADGFMEWPAEELLPKGAEKRPNYFRFTDHRMYFFAGLWERAKDDEGGDFYSANIITVEPNELLSALPHHRMPAILPPDALATWLNPDSALNDVLSCLVTTPATAMTGHPIANHVNFAQNDFPECISPVVPQPPQTLFE